MASRSSESPIHQIQVLFDEGAVGSLSDGQLIERFLAGDGDVATAAFGALVRRHGPMVHGACLLILKDRHETEDAFQATFLVLARKAGSIRRRDSLPSWLLGVARRVAVRLKRSSSRRRVMHQRLAGATDGWYSPEEGRPEEISVLHEEIGRLPARFRVPVLLCYLEGMTYEDAARALGATEGSIRGRLAQARERLRRRLARRGLAPDGALRTMVLSSRDLAEARAAVMDSTIRGSLRIAESRATVAGSASSSVTVLTEGTLKAMRFSKIRAVAFVVLAACLAAAGAGAVVPAGGEGPAEVREAGRVTNPTAASEFDALQGTWVRIATESGGTSRLLPESQRNTLLIRGSRFKFGGQASPEEARIEPARTPKAIDLMPTGDDAGPLKGKTYFGIYELEDDTLMLCLDIYHKSERPTGFTTKPGDRPLIDLYKRIGP